MSYFLQRLKIAEIAQVVSDTSPINPSEITYDEVVSLDAKFQHFVDTLPAFFKIESSQTKEVCQIDKDHSYVPAQRLVLAIMLNLTRCKLHFPHLVGSANTALHIFSRHACLKAAQSVLSAHRDMSDANLSHSADFMKLQGTIHLMFVGALVLATDLCCNRPRGAKREQQASELTRACNVLASIQQHSQLASKFLDSLTQLLIKCGVWSLPATAPLPTNEQPSNHDDALQQWQFDDYLLEDGVLEHQDLDTSLLFDDLWETFIDRPSAMNMIDIP